MRHCREIKIGDVWRTCNKIRAAIFRMGLNLFEYFSPLDPNKNCLISESEFIAVINGQLRATVGLSEQEVAELADFFRVPDGRIYYTQLCEVIHNSVPEFSQNPPLVTGLEWEDPMHTNRLSATEERRLSILLTKIATMINMRKIILRPYFQDYELVSKNNGTITLAHFARILAFLEILLSSDDFNLLIKKYIKDSYTVNYNAFLHDIDTIVEYLNANGMIDLNGDMTDWFPGKVISADLPKLPRPEIGKIMASRIFGKQSIFHSALTDPKKIEHILTTLSNLQDHVFKNRIRVAQFFKDFDTFNCGRITITQFERGLDELTLSGRQRFFLSRPDVVAITNQYRDPTDFSRVCWRTFEDDIEHVFTVKGLEKTPSLQVESPPEAIKNLLPLGGKDWQSVNTLNRELCETAVDKVKQKILHRRILLKPVFRDFDRHNNGHVTRSQMRQAFYSNGILLSDEEISALEERFNNNMGFNYLWFLKDVENNEQEPIYKQFIEDSAKVSSERPIPPATRQEKDIVLIMAKIKGKVVRERIRVLEFMRGFDRLNTQVITRDEFKRGLSNCRFALTPNEMNTLCDVFASPLRPMCIDYRRFCEVVEEVFTQLCLERSPLIIPVQHIPTKDCEKNFLNFDERNKLSVAMQKLAMKPDMQMNLSSILQAFDKSKTGIISPENFLKSLNVRDMDQLISRNEFDIICKCFAFERGTKDEVDYKAFMKALDILNATVRYNPF